MRECLLSLKACEAKHVLIFLYASLQSLQVGTIWYRTLLTLASRYLIWLIVVDEAHSVAQDNRNFCPDFQFAVMTLQVLYNNQHTMCNWIAISATFWHADQDVSSGLLGQAPDKVNWLKLSRQGIHFDVVVSGNPFASITLSVTQDYKYEMRMKTIIYTNSKKQAWVLLPMQ
jgi:superfamily II DNA helicase RecQ